MKATVLVDNLSDGALGGEWGLSLYIEYNGQKILLDTGASGLFAENAEKLGLPLDRVDFAVLSHAHYDHGNGFPEFFRRNGGAKLYLQRGCGEDCYKKKLLYQKYIGLPRGMMRRYKDRIIPVIGLHPVTEGVSLLSHTTMGLAVAGEAEHMYRRERLRFRPDSFIHEQSLIFETERGLVIFNSCCHGGASVVVREAMEAFPGQKVLALVGGFHLFNKKEKMVRAFARELLDTGVEQIWTGHCTGERAYAILTEELGDRVGQLRTGLVMEF